MANANRPTGLSPVSIYGAPYAGQGNIYAVAANYGTAIAIGDPVASLGGASPDGYPLVGLAAAGTAIRGVVVGIGRSPTVLANWGNLDTTVRPASAGYVGYLLVADDPNIVFEIQQADTVNADIGDNADLVAGANNGYVSGYTLSSTVGTATAQCRILGLVNRPDNEFGDYAKVLVRINEHELSSATGV
jgi:hypothetical protein